jgi:heptosyltransferase-1
LKVLIIRLSAIGDTVHALPVAAAIKRHLPEVELSWLVEPLSAPLLQNNPAVDQVFVLPRKTWLRNLANPGKFLSVVTEAGAFFQELRSQKFDYILDLHGLLKSAVCGALSGGTRRIGYVGAREGSQFFLTDKVEVGDYYSDARHIVETNLLLVQYLGELAGNKGLATCLSSGAIEFPLPKVPPESLEKMERLLKRTSLVRTRAEINRRVAFIPGTTWSSKIWPLDKWVQLGRYFIEQNWQVVLSGAQGEKAGNAQLFEQIASQIAPGAGQLIDLTGQTDLIDLIALFNTCDIVIGADTGPLHLAAATARPAVLGIYGSTPWRRNGPYGSTSLSLGLDLFCQPCFKVECPLGTLACLKKLQAPVVYAKALELWQGACRK